MIEVLSAAILIGALRAKYSDTNLRGLGTLSEDGTLLLFLSPFSVGVNF